jgi:hypothetical protein
MAMNFSSTTTGTAISRGNVYDSNGPYTCGVGNPGGPCGPGSRPGAGGFCGPCGPWGPNCPAGMKLVLETADGPPGADDTY